jgi:hypothetical protein
MDSCGYGGTHVIHVYMLCVSLRFSVLFTIVCVGAVTVNILISWFMVKPVVCAGVMCVIVRTA